MIILIAFKVQKGFFIFLEVLGTFRSVPEFIQRHEKNEIVILGPNKAYHLPDYGLLHWNLADADGNEVVVI